MASLVQNNNEHSMTSPEQKFTGEFGALAGDKSPSLPGTTNFGKSIDRQAAHMTDTTQQLAPEHPPPLLPDHAGSIPELDAIIIGGGGGGVGAYSYIHVHIL